MAGFYQNVVPYRSQAAPVSHPCREAAIWHNHRHPRHVRLGDLSAPLQRSRASDYGEQQEYLDDVITSGESLLALLNDILDLSRIEAGKLTLELVDFDPAEVARGVCSLLAEGARRKGLRLTCKLPTSLPRQLQGDPVRLRQTLVNLVGNAIKFTERGCVDLEVEVEGESDHLVTIRFTVKDTGIGISKEAQRRIFESFVQADGSVTRKYGGSGLGLSISSELITKMAGELRLESAPGEGSRFWFVLPFEKGHEMSSGAVDQCLPREFELGWRARRSLRKIPQTRSGKVRHAFTSDGATDTANPNLVD